MKLILLNSFRSQLGLFSTFPSPFQCMKWPVAHSPNSTWIWLELVGNCCERLEIIMECTNIQFCERLGHGWQFHPLPFRFRDGWNEHKFRGLLQYTIRYPTQTHFNSLAPGRPRCHFKTAIFNLVLLIGIFTSSGDNALRWMPRDLTNDKSTLVQVMAWCRQATSHYLSQCWPSSMSYGITRPQWVNSPISQWFFP